MQRKFCHEIQRLVDEKGEEFARKYIRTYCEVMLDDPQVDVDTKTKIQSVLEFLNENVIN